MLDLWGYYSRWKVHGIYDLHFTSCVSMFYFIALHPPRNTCLCLTLLLISKLILVPSADTCRSKNPSWLIPKANVVVSLT
jgi:hypothetical protein